MEPVVLVLKVNFNFFIFKNKSENLLTKNLRFLNFETDINCDILIAYLSRRLILT